jgi:N-acetylmuramic acid 6-phosphate etherase
MAEPRSPRPRTELPNPATRDLDRLELRPLLVRILDEDARVAVAVRAALPALERACELLVARLARGGRWFNAGAGTSGRLGLLDAAEIPPTFGLAPDRVQALIAGGADALSRAVEGAEDDVDEAVRELSARGLCADDALVAISASGSTPYALAAVRHARGVGAATIAITCDPDAPLAHACDVAIAAVVGPEVIAGSTRLKGGLAQKMILHTLSTAVMVRLGRVRGNLMTGVRAANQKLRERALWIACELSGRSRQDAERALDQADGDVERALALLARPGALDGR